MQRRLELSNGHHIRIGDAAGWPCGQPKYSDVLFIEYQGRLGHPSSYGMLGGAAVTSEVSVPTGGALSCDGKPYPESLAGLSDDVSFGLPAEFLAEIRLASSELLADRYGLSIEIAAHGRVGSSPYVFGALARFLISMLQEPVTVGSTDQMIRSLWGTARDGQDASLRWEVEVVDVFDITGRDGVVIVGRWLTEGVIRAGTTGVLVRADQEDRVYKLSVELHQPEAGVAVFLPGRRKKDVAPGDRLASTYEFS